MHYTHGLSSLPYYSVIPFIELFAIPPPLLPASLPSRHSAAQSNNDYSIRMRDIAFQERLKKMTERYTTELDHNREQYDLLREEKMDIDHEFSERLKAMEITHQAEMQKRESLYQST